MTNRKENIQRCEAWFEELKKADARLRSFPNANGQQNLGKPSDACMRWAINLATTDINKLSAGDFINLQNEVECFTRFGLRPPEIGNLVDAGTPPQKEMITLLQEWLSDNIAKVLKKQTVKYLAPEEMHYLFPPEDDRPIWRHDTVGFLRDDDPGYLFYFQLLSDHVNNLSRCPASDCSRIFLKDRTNQTFCSAQCQWRAATRRVRQTPVERFGKRGRPRKEELNARSSKKEKSTSKKAGRTKTKGGKHGRQGRTGKKEK